MRHATPTLNRLLLLLAFSIGGPRLSAATIHVSATQGDDTRAGTAGTEPVRTLARGLALCGPGDTLSIDPTAGPYRESLVFGARGGLPGNPVTVEGNGAVLTGLEPVPADAWQDQDNGLWLYPNTVRRGAHRPFLVDANGTRLAGSTKRPDELTPGEACWPEQGAFIRCRTGETPAQLELSGTMRISGAAFSGASHVVIRNLVCEYFANDGFNVHGSCYGLVFQRIVARHNGDDGFSVHEDVGATVQGGWFHHNTFGIQDINTARSLFSGILAEHNRSHGAHFVGGFNSVTDSVIRDNHGDQVRISPGAAKHLGVHGRDPMLTGTAYLANVAILGGKTGVAVTDGARASVRHCFIAGAETGILAAAEAHLHVKRTVTAHCTLRELHAESGNVHVNENAYFPGRIRWQDTLFAPDQFAAYRKVSGQDAMSSLAPPLYTAAAAFRIASPTVTAAGRALTPGLRREPSLPFLDTIPNPFAEQHAVAAAQTEWQFDFEAANPWCRVYPQPEKAPNGKSVVGKTELTNARAVSGKRCLKLDVTFPAGAAERTWLVKLFSVKFEYCRSPIRSLQFQLHGDGSGLPFRPRIRDNSGEYFYGPEHKLDWHGWRQVSWDLQQTPPEPVHSGDGNRIQNGPPLEIVLELYPVVGPDGAHMELYIDDLEFCLEPAGD